MSDLITSPLPSLGLGGEMSLEELLLRAGATERILDPSMLMGRVTLSRATLKRMARKARLKEKKKPRRVGRPFLHWKTRAKNNKASKAKYYKEKWQLRRQAMSLTPEGSYELIQKRWKSHWEVSPLFWRERVWPVVSDRIYSIKSITSNTISDSNLVVIDRYSKDVIYSSI